MTKQDNTEHEQAAPNKVVRLIRLELVTNGIMALSFIPSSFLPQVVMLLEQADEIEIRLKIDRS